MIISVCMAGASVVAEESQPDAAASMTRWVERFSQKTPPVETGGVCAGQIGELPAFEGKAVSAGRHLVRVSLPFSRGALPKGMGVTVRCGQTECVADLRVLTIHPGRPESVRRAIVTFPFEFSDTDVTRFQLVLTDGVSAGDGAVQSDSERCVAALGAVSVELTADHATINVAGGPTWTAMLIAPPRAQGGQMVAETIELGQHYLWVRVLAPDTVWPRIIEARIDSLGTVAVQAHLQRLQSGDATAPDLGWDIFGPALKPTPPHSFTEMRDEKGRFSLETADGSYQITFPVAPYYRRGSVSVTLGQGSATARFFRCRADEKVPFQQAAWRRAEFVVGRTHHTPRNALLEPRLDIAVPSDAYDAVYASGRADDLSLWPILDDLRRYTRHAVKRCAREGDDFGNVTMFAHGTPPGAFGMNRLNHCAAIFDEAYRAADRELLDVAAHWCSNMYDLSLWWGDADDFGGTRYNNSSAMGQPDHQADTSFMWRGNGSVTFCTKGVDAFFYAYEETGDPRMLTALLAQVEYARKYVHADQGECRNIGIAADFMNLFRFTGVPMFRDEAMRLFRELRSKLSPGDLFSQGGQPIIQDGPFIDDDQAGYKAPFAKPYIIGYALAGLPELLRERPDEPKLRDVVRAVADFLARSQDPVGGWRYPHPQSSTVLIDQGMEHAAQIARAAAVLEQRGESTSELLDAMEQVLQARVLAYERSGRILSSLAGWERSTESLKEGQTLYDLYKKPSDRDRARDYTEGNVGAGGASPEGLVYFSEVLHFYLSHRPAERLFHANNQLAAVLARVPDQRIRLIPQENGSFVRMERPENPEVGFLLWAPEWATFPKLGYGPEELGGMKLEWKRDEASGALSYSIERPEATFSACFIPRVDYVECTYAAWPNQGAVLPAQFGVGPCQQMKAGIFEGDETELLNRLWFLSNGQWTSIASCAGGNSRNVLFIAGQPSPEMTGAMAEGGWKTIQRPRPDNALVACISKDGKWLAAAAAEFANSICNNSGASHRCIHSQGLMPLNLNGPTVLRAHVYLIEGSLDDLKKRYEADVQRWKATSAAPSAAETRTLSYGLRADLPTFNDAQVRRMTFPLAWPADGMAFPNWRAEARRVYLDSLLPAPLKAPFAPCVLAVEDRGSYEARKLALNISADSRIRAYLLVPKGPGPFPAIVALHDHGAHFSIGKEKVVRPFDELQERVDNARNWVEKYYGGSWIGDELAKRGYAVFAADALFWGDRGRLEGVKYESQQTLAANMFQLGLSWAGNIIWDDVRSAEFVQGLPEVDPDRIGCIGLSMGANRTWHLAAATDIIKAGAAICWMGDTPTLTAEGNNQTKGQSAFSMLHPGLRNALDYPDVAAIACPKPMLFFNGEQDSLFPVAGVQACYEKMRRVWREQGVEERLVTKLWPVPHEFNAAMQQEAFDWLDKEIQEIQGNPGTDYGIERIIEFDASVKERSIP